MSIDLRSSKPITLPERVRNSLTQFRLRARLVRVLELILAAICLWLLGYLLVFVSERVWALSSFSRTWILMLGSAGFLVGGIWMMPSFIWKTRHLEQIARMIGHRFPTLGEELLSIIEMLRPGRQSDASPRLIAAATTQTTAKLSNYTLNEAITVAVARQRALATGIVLLFVIVVSIITPAAAFNAFVRYSSPWTTTPRFTYTRTSQIPEEVFVPYAEASQIKIGLKSDSLWRPESAQGRIDTTQLTANLQGDHYQFAIPSVSVQSLMQIQIGDVSHQIKITPMTRPELKDAAAHVTLPEYLERKLPITQSAGTGRLSAVTGSRVSLDLLVNHPVESAWRDSQSLKVVSEHVYAEEKVAGNDQVISIQWKDRYGLQSAQPVNIELNALTDQIPEIVFEQIENKVLLENRTLKFSFWGRDDFGIRRIGLEWSGQSDSSSDEDVMHGEKIIFSGHSEAVTVKEEGAFSPRMLSISPQQLTLRLFIEDFDPSHGRIYSSPQSLRVMSSDEHASWINESMQRWKSVADSIYEREVQLAEENKRLRELSEEELRKPENLRRMENQVAAEKENSQRLDQAVQQGKRLIDEALMNEAMSADDVATWADSLSRLKTLANKDMLNIAQKLDEISRASLASSLSDNADINSSAVPSDINLEREKKQKDDPKSSPSLSKQESTMLPSGEREETEEGANRLTLPSTELLNPKREGQGNEKEKKDPPPDKKSLDEVVNQHDDLLREFEKARDAMDEAMANFENSTFVKRFKATSRAQTQIASRVNRLMSQMFGKETAVSESISDAIEDLSVQQRKVSEQAAALQSDLNAYQSREPQSSRQAILEEMDTMKMNVKLSEMPTRLERGRPGDVLHRSEFWADTFDRWAEELVPPTKSGGGGGGDDENPSLPPAIALEVLRQIDDEMALRDETRSFELARQAMTPDEVIERNNGLTISQMAIQERALTTLNDILAIPDGSQKFGDEIKKLKNAIIAMDDASGMLFDCTTGEPAVASETAAIEALIESRRRDPPADTGPRKKLEQDGSEKLAGQSPWDILGPEGDEPLRRNPRDVGAGTSPHLDTTPERYRNGLDRFSNRLSRFRKR